MARQTGYMITFDDAIFMVNNEGFTELTSIPSDNKCMTRSEIEQYLGVDTSFSNFTSYLSNQLVPYEKIQPLQTAWRGIDPFCEQDGSGTPPDTYSYQVEGGTSSDSQACILANQGNFGTTLWSTSDTLTTGILLYTSQTDAENGNTGGFPQNGFYATLISNNEASIQINNGELVNITFC